MENRNNYKKTLILILLILVFFLNTFLSVLYKSSTYDEGAHLKYGINILKGNSNRFDDSKMPFSILNGITHSICTKIVDIINFCAIKFYSKDIINQEKRSSLALIAARIGTILFSIIIIIYIYNWSSKLYGSTAGIFSVILYIFTPDIIAHSQLVTTDIYAAGMVTIACYYYWRFLNNINYRNMLLSSLTLGLAQLAKYSCILIYPVFLLTGIIFFIGKQVNINPNLIEVKYFIKKILRYLIVYIAITLIIVNLGFLFNKPFTKLKDYKFKSEIFKSMQNISLLSNLVVPLPYPYLEGLDWVIFRENTGEGYGNIYLLGRLKTKNDKFEGFKGYYLVAMLLKLPITIIIFIIYMVIILLRKGSFSKIITNEIFLLLPAITYFIYFNFFMNAQIGIRHILIVYPLLYILCGSIISYGKNEFYNKVVIISLIIYLVISSLSYYPHYLSYFNEIVWDRKNSYLYLADSNIDWGQNEWYLEKYMEKHPNVKLRPKEKEYGKIIVSVNELVGIFNPNQYKWLREKYKPIGHVGYSYLIFDVKD